MSTQHRQGVFHTLILHQRHVFFTNSPLFIKKTCFVNAYSTSEEKFRMRSAEQESKRVMYLPTRRKRKWHLHTFTRYPRDPSRLLCAHSHQNERVRYVLTPHKRQKKVACALTSSERMSSNCAHLSQDITSLIFVHSSSQRTSSAWCHSLSENECGIRSLLIRGNEFHMRSLLIRGNGFCERSLLNRRTSFAFTHSP